MVLGGEVVTGADGSFAGFRGSVQSDGAVAAPPSSARTAAFDHALDEVLRSPLDRIIESAERIVERADGPLRSDYASYGNDIAAAARHLLSVLDVDERRTRSGSALGRSCRACRRSGRHARFLGRGARRHDRARQHERACCAKGEERAVIQILVNLIGNAIRYSPRRRHGPP